MKSGIQQMMTFVKTYRNYNIYVAQLKGLLKRQDVQSNGRANIVVHGHES